MLNKCRMLTLSLGLSALAFAGDNSLFKVFDLPEEEKNAVIDYCAPSGDLIEVPEKDGALFSRPSYPSDDLGLVDGDIPPYELIGKPLPEKVKWTLDPRIKKLQAFLELIADPGTEQDACDRVAVLYVARFIAKYWPGGEAALKDHKLASVALQLLRTENAPLIRNARIEARKMLLL